MWQRPVLALGNFDGLHRGHVAIIARVRSRAYERGVLPIALTFDPQGTRISFNDLESITNQYANAL